MRWYDAHCHWHDARLAPFAEQITEDLRSLPIGGAVVNGTRPADWETVRRFVRTQQGAQAAYGVHPWQVDEAVGDWRERLEAALREDPSASIGEVGLDRWVQGHDLPRQREVLRAQLELARKYERPVTVHCLRAWGAVLEDLQAARLPRGFLLHSYGGPAEMVERFVALGSYFSFSPYFLHPRKAVAREVFAQIPRERLLVETDAPDMFPPPERSRFLLEVEGQMLNHPGNLQVAYEGLAEVRGLPMEALAELVEQNFWRLFEPAKD